MKFSPLQMISIFCILAMGFLTVPPGVQTADAHGDAHEYDVTVVIVEVTVCKKCGAGVSAIVIGSSTIKVPHGDGETHATRAVMWLYTPGPDTCENCEKST